MKAKIIGIEFEGTQEEIKYFVDLYASGSLSKLPGSITGPVTGPNTFKVGGNNYDYKNGLVVNTTF